MNLDELKRVCVSMLQGTSETVTVTMTCALGLLCSEKGQRVQQAAFQAIREASSSLEDAFDNAFKGEDVPYIVALYKEVMRYQTAVPYSLPRMTTKEVKYHDLVIPKGTTL